MTLETGETPQRRAIDAHQHLWLISEREYSWITPEYAALYRDFRPEDYLDAVSNSAIRGTVLVQSADTYDDTFYMLGVATKYAFVEGVVGWIPFDRPEEARAALNIFKLSPSIKGFRNLSHDYSNPKYESDDKWILRGDVLKSLTLISDANLSLDYVAVNDRHIEAITEVAQELPNLRIVIDHLAKPNIAMKEMSPWKELMKAAAECGNISVKLSGLNTASSDQWSVQDWQPYFDFIFSEFGSHRIILGSDWPVITLKDNFNRVWGAQLQLLSNLSIQDQDLILYGNATHFYNLLEEN